MRIPNLGSANASDAYSTLEPLRPRTAQPLGLKNRPMLITAWSLLDSFSSVSGEAPRIAAVRCFPLPAFSFPTALAWVIFLLKGETYPAATERFANVFPRFLSYEFQRRSSIGGVRKDSLLLFLAPKPCLQ